MGKLTHWKKRLLKKLDKLTRKQDIELWSLDECHFQQHGSRISMWVPPENKDPVLLMAPTRKSVSLFGAVNLSSGKFRTRFEARFDALAFKKFLEYLLRSRAHNKKIVLLLDNARYHHAKILEPFLAKRKKQIKLLFLPAYSPDLNPIERVWKLTRRLCTHNRYFEKINELTDAVMRQHCEWKKPNETLRRLCCIK